MVWYIALGSAIGGASRYLLGSVLQARFGSAFPMNTLLINVTGSLLLGFLVRSALVSTSITPEVRAFLTTGFCGGYTTFSTYSYETAVLIEGGQYGRATLYAGLSVAGALLGTFLGFALAHNVLVFRERM